MKRRTFIKSVPLIAASGTFVAARKGQAQTAATGTQSAPVEDIPILLECGINGTTTKKRNPLAPESVDEHISEMGKCIEAGATIVHNHSNIGSPDPQSQCRAGAGRLGRHPEHPARELELRQAIGIVVGNDPALDDRPGVIAADGSDIGTHEDVLQFAIGHNPALFHDDEVIAQAAHLVDVVTDIDDRYGRFTMQTIEERQNVVAPRLVQ